MIKKVFYLTISILMVLTMSSCIAKSFEKELNIVFMYEGEYVSSGTITQFKNIKTPELSEAYIPDGYKFFGWTPLDPNTVKATDPDFDNKYIGDGKMLHWSDVNEYASNSTVICHALMIDKDEIPVPYHYVVIAWYDKVATSGLDSNLMSTFQNSLFAYLRSQGVTEEDINTIVIRGYTGNVGTSCGQIMDDEDVDIMFGWSSISNVTSTGGMSEEMLLEAETSFSVGAKTRSVYRLSEKDTAKLVFNWMKTEECRNIFA